jgi:hypothetical protein
MRSLLDAHNTTHYQRIDRGGETPPRVGLDFTFNIGKTPSKTKIRSLGSILSLKGLTHMTYNEYIVAALFEPRA